MHRRGVPMQRASVQNSSLPTLVAPFPASPRANGMKMVSLVLTALALSLSPACSESNASTAPASSRGGPLGASVEYFAAARDEFVEHTSAQLADLQRRRTEHLGDVADSAVAGRLLGEERAAHQRLEELRRASPREWELLRPGMQRCLEDLRGAVEALASGG